MTDPAGEPAESLISFEPLALDGVSRTPAPSAGSEPAGDNALTEDVRNHVAIAGQQRLGRTHFCTNWQLALGQAVPPVLLEFGLAHVIFWATGTEGTFVHLAPRTIVTGLRILRRAKRTRIEAVTTPDTQVLGVQNHTLVSLVETVDRADSHAGCVRAMHTGYRDRTFARLTVLDGHHATAVHTPRHLVLVLTCGDTGITLNAAFRITQELHSSH